MHRYAVVGEKGVEYWAQHTALWYSSFYIENGGGVVTEPNRLWSVGEKIQGPVTEGGADAKINELGDQLGWDHCIEGITEINE